MSITLTVFFDGQFWSGVFERIDNEQLSVSRVVFGAEPKEQQVLEFILEQYYDLRFSPPVDGVKAQAIASNPKRRQRQAARAQEQGIGTKSQQAMKLAHEESKLERTERSKEQRELEEQRKFELHIEKKKAKHRGH